MGKSTFRGFAKPGDIPPLAGAFITGANLRRPPKTKLTTPPSRRRVRRRRATKPGPAVGRVK